MTSRSLVALLSLVLAAGLFVAGCSSLPTSPGAEVPGTAPGSAGGDSTAAAGAASSPSPAVALSRSTYVRALLGGIVSAGDFRVVIPPGALPGDAIVTVRQPDRTKPVVELDITPGDRNAFRLPVLLIADVSTLDASLVSGSYLSWWNPDAARWEACDQSAVNPAAGLVQAPLWHFSKYRVEREGKAGW